jgi:hypothetical protein
MDREVVEQISTLVRSGFFGRDDMLDIVCEDLFPGEVDPDEVLSVIDAESRKLAAEQSSWPAVTDCDRLDDVFEKLIKRGIAALQNAGYSQDDGYDAVWQAFPDASDNPNTIGYCFYHGQDLEGATRGEGLCLAFGPVNAGDEAAKGPQVGRIIREELEKAGFQVSWDGTFNQRILIPKFDWKRRLST